MKKKIGMVLTMMFTMSALISGCGKTAQEGKENAPKEPQETQVIEETKELEETKKGQLELSEEATKGQRQEIQLFIANSLNDAMIEIADLYRNLQPDTTITMNALGSQELREQIESGMECDVFISASMSHMTALGDSADHDYVKDDSIVKLLSNELVLITGKDSDSKVISFATIPECAGVFALAGEEVPVGNYSRQAFAALDIIDEVLALSIDEKTKVGDVKNAVSEGMAELGTVYLSDTYGLEDKLTIIDKADSSWFEKPIVYPMGIINNDKADEAKKMEVEAFYQFLQSEEAMKVFEKYQFISYIE